MVCWTTELALHPYWSLLDDQSKLTSPLLTYRQLVEEYNRNPKNYTGLVMLERQDLTLLPDYTLRQETPKIYAQRVSDFMDYLHQSGKSKAASPYMLLLDSPFIKQAITSTHCLNNAITHQVIDGGIYWVFRGEPYIAQEIPDKTAIREKHSQLIDKMSQDKKDGETFNELYFFSPIGDRWELGTKLLWLITKYTNFDVQASFDIFQGASVFDPMWLAPSKSGRPKAVEYIHKLLKDRPIFHKNEIEGFLRLHYDLQYNEVTHRVELKQEGAFSPLSDYQLNSIYRHLSQKGANLSIQKLRHLLESDFTPRFHPFRSYFESLPETASDRDPILELAGTVTTTNQPYWQWSLKKWLVAAVACAINPEVVNHQVLVFMGGQGIGKTWWLEKLLPKQLANYIYSGVLDPSSKDSLVHLAECFLLNLDELDALSRKKEAELKEIITKKTLRYRVAYGHFPIITPAMPVLWAVSITMRFCMTAQAPGGFWSMSARL